MSDDLRRQLERAARDAEHQGRLPSVDAVRRRGDQRRVRTRAVQGVAAALVVVAAGGGWFLTQDRPEPVTPASPTTTAPEEIVPAPPTYTIRTGDGTPLTTGVEGGASLATDEPANMANWYLDATADGYALRNESQTDGRPICLQIAVEDSVSSDSCDGSAAQAFDIARVQGMTYTLANDLGFVATDADGGLTTSTDPADATVFTITDATGAGPDL